MNVSKLTGRRSPVQDTATGYFADFRNELLHFDEGPDYVIKVDLRTNGIRLNYDHLLHTQVRE